VGRRVYPRTVSVS